MTEFTTIEKLALGITPCYDAIIRYKGFVCVARMNHLGKYEAEVYEFIESDFSEIENRLSLIDSSKEHSNSGEAIAKCFEWIDRHIEK